MTSTKKHADEAGQIYVGCSGWAYPSWKPEFYPAKTPAKKLLEYYATRLNSVEVNYTFRSLPAEKTVESWLEATGAGFCFSFKAPQRITHILRLKNCAEALERFAGSLAPVVEAKRLGVVLFQLPPNMKADVERLAAFLDEAQPFGFRMAFEFRDESWFGEETYAVLRAHSAGLCIAESDELATPEVHTAPFRCYRFRRSEYSAVELSGIATKLRTCASRGDVFGYFKHEETPVGALRAVQVLEEARSA